MQNKTATQQQKKSYLFILGLVIFFTAPLALVMYMHSADWHPQGDSNGHLIKPVIAIKVPSGIQGIPTALNEAGSGLWQDKWNMVMVTETCDASCEARLHDVRQIHASLEKDINRVQRILITHQQDASALKKQYPDLLILNQPSDDVDMLIAQFNQGKQNAATAHQLYLVDPLGNWMMAYAEDVSAIDIRKDIVKLLKYSWAG